VTLQNGDNEICVKFFVILLLHDTPVDSN